MRKLLLMALVLFPAGARAARVRTFPPQPVHLGEYITVEIDLPVRAEWNGDPNYATVNFARSWSRWKVENGQPTTTYTVYGAPSSASDILLGPFTYRGSDGREVTVPAVRIPVLPDIADGSKPAESLAALAKAGRTPVVLYTSMKKPVVFVGEEAVVQWWTIAEFNNQSIRGSITTTPAVEGISGSWTWSPDMRAFDSIGGVLVKKELRTELHLMAKTPGVYTVPSAVFEGEDPTRSYEAQGWRQPFRFRRTAPPIRFEVAPRPAAARGPIGKFELQCQAYGNSGPWPTLMVGVSGSGSLEGAQPPRFVARPDVTVVARPVPNRSYRETGRSWAYAVHAEEAGLPGLTFAYYDSDRNENVETRCGPQTVRASQQLPPSTAADEKKKADAAREPIDRSVSNLLEIAGLLMVGGAGYVLARTIWG